MKNKKKSFIELNIEDSEYLCKKQDKYYDKKYGIEAMLYQILNNQIEIMKVLNKLK